MDVASEYNLRACYCFPSFDVLAAAATQAQLSVDCKAAPPSYNALRLLDRKKWKPEDHLVTPI